MVIVPSMTHTWRGRHVCHGADGLAVIESVALSDQETPSCVYFVVRLPCGALALWPAAHCEVLS